jgi:hypothetical protein
MNLWEVDFGLNGIIKIVCNVLSPTFVMISAISPSLQDYDVGCVSVSKVTRAVRFICGA